MKMLFFDFRELEKPFFETHHLCDFEIEFIKSPLNEKTKLSDEQLKNTDAICVFTTSAVNSKVIEKFSNLRVISTRSTDYGHIDTKYCNQRRISVFNIGNNVEKKNEKNEDSINHILETTFNNIRDYQKGMHTNQVY